MAGGEECYEVRGARLELRVCASPGAARTAIAGVRGAELRVRIAAAPERGRANRELVRFLAQRLGVARSSLALLAGESSRHKRVGLPLEARGRLEALLRPAAPG